MAYKIDPEVLHKVAQEVVAEDLPLEDMFIRIRERLSEEFPGVVEPEERCWLGSRAGGVLGKMTFLFGSMTEYLIIFGTPVSTAGFSGRYNFMEIHDFFIAGETRTCDLESGQTEPSIYHAGDRGFMHKGQSLTCEIRAGAWMIEYGRGPNITSLPFALADSLLSSIELRSFFLTIKEYSYFVNKQIKSALSNKK